MLDMNVVVRYLILSDFIFVGGLGLLAPVFAIFIEKSIIGGSAIVVGTASSIYLITKSLVQVPAASIVDHIKGEKDDFWVLFVSSLIGATVPLAYMYVSTPLELYLVQFVYGSAMAFAFPTYMALFTRHVDKDKEGTEWGIYFTFSNLSSAFAAFVGGVIVSTVGFNTLIILMVVLSIMGVLLIYPIHKHIYHVPVRRADVSQDGQSVVNTRQPSLQIEPINSDSTKTPSIPME